MLEHLIDGFSMTYTPVHIDSTIVCYDVRNMSWKYGLYIT